jgi:hypothetical protein
MLLYIHGKFTMGCRYCLNVAIDTWKVYNGMQVLPECCYRYMESLKWDAGNLHPIVNFPCMYNNIQAVTASHCEFSVYV